MRSSDGSFPTAAGAGSRDASARLSPRHAAPVGLRRRLLVAAAVLLGLASATGYALWPNAAAPVAAAAGPLSSRTPEPAAARFGVVQPMLALVDQVRARAGCGGLRWDARLASAAAGHSADMVQRRYFDHASPDGETPWDRAHAAGYPDPSAENIAAGSPTFDATMLQWMNSPGHRANILNCKFVAMGIGEADGGPMRHYWTQMFGYV